ncbi:MAG: hypothetical protein AAB553_05955 [Patescibacteria group bacterium]
MAVTKKTNVRVFAFLALLALLIGIPGTLFLNRQTQDVRTQAATGTAKLYFTPETTQTTPLKAGVDQPISLDVMIDPNGHYISLIKMEITYDPSLFTAPPQAAFTPNPQAFPVTIEGPNIQNGKIQVTLSIDRGDTRGIQQITKVGTLQLTTTKETTQPGAVSFSSLTQALSIKETDSATTNVLQTTIPAYIAIVAEPTSTPTPLPTNTPLPTATPLPLPSQTPLPTATVIPTATGLSPTTSGTTLKLNLLLHGLGTGGDNANPTATGNFNPLRPNKPVTIEFYNNQNTLIGTKPTTVTFNQGTGTFTGEVTIGSLPNGSYIIKVKGDQYLKTQFPGIQDITAGLITLPPVDLVTGDINNDNQLNIVDYNILMGCYSDFLPASNCTDQTKLQSDITDDGDVNQYDYNLFLREIGNRTGE